LNNSPMKAIRAYCMECNYDPLDKGTAVAQIESCTINKCPLYGFRPLTSATKKKLKEERIQNMSPKELAKYNKRSEQAKERFSKYRK
jgi:hypothetical protein